MTLGTSPWAVMISGIWVHAPGPETHIKVQVHIHMRSSLLAPGLWIMISRYLSPWCGHPGAVNKERLGLAKDFNQERNSRKNLGNSPADQSGPKHDLTEGSTTASGLRKGKQLYEKEPVMHRTHTSKVQLKMAREK